MDLRLPTVKEWLVKLTDLAEMDKLTSLVREKALFTFISDWLLLTDFLG